MRLLLDTHIAVWSLTGHPRLGEKALDLITDRSNAVFISAVNVLEVGIKHSLGKTGLDAMLISARQFLQLSESSNLEVLPVLAEHAALAAELPPHHRDPFDRLLVAQAQADGLRLLTRDKTVIAYGDMTLAV